MAFYEDGPSPRSTTTPMTGHVNNLWSTVPGCQRQGLKFWYQERVYSWCCLTVCGQIDGFFKCTSRITFFHNTTNQSSSDWHNSHKNPQTNWARERNLLFLFSPSHFPPAKLFWCVRIWFFLIKGKLCKWIMPFTITL